MSVSYKSTTSLATGSWQHLAVTIDQTNGSVTFFLNNNMVGTHKASNISILQNSEDILVGRNANSEFFNGMMDDVRVYSRVLSASELGSVFNHKNEGSLISKYDFEKFDLEAMEVYDEGPYGYTGSLMNVGANENALTNDVGKFAINKTAFESLVDEYVEIDGSDPTNKLQGSHLNNCTFAAWVKLGSNTNTFEPIMVKPGVLSFGVKDGRVILQLGDGAALHELPMMSMSEMGMGDEKMSGSSTTQRVSNKGYSTVDTVPNPIASSAYFKQMGYRGFEWNFQDSMYDNSSVFKLHTVDARSKTHNQFSVDDSTRMAASYGKLSAESMSYTAMNWCRETNNQYWYLRAGYDGMEMPSWGEGESPMTLTLRFKVLDPSNLNTSAVSIMYGQGASDEGFANQTWNNANHENHYFVGEFYGTGASAFSMRCSTQEGSAGGGRTESSVFSGNANDLYTSSWNTLTLVHDPVNTKTILYLNYTEVCSISKVATFPESGLCKLRVGTFPINSASYVNRGIHIKDIDMLDTALSDSMTKHYIQNRRSDSTSDLSSQGLKAHYTFDENSSSMVDDSVIVPGMGISEGSRAVRFDPADTNSLEIPGEVFSSDKTFFFGTWMKPESVSGYRPILSRTEGDNNMQFGLRNGVLEFSASTSKPVTMTDISGTHVYNHETSDRVCNVLGTVSNSEGGTVYLGLFEKFYSDLMKSEVKTFMVDTMSGSSAVKQFTIPADSFGVSIAGDMNEFFADINSTSSQGLNFATQQLNLVILVVDPSDNLTVRSYPLNYTAINNSQDGAHASGKSELYLNDGYTYSLTTMREENTPEEYTDWYLVMNYLRKENENVRAVSRTPIGMSSDSNVGYEGFPMERQEYDKVDINGDFVSETYESMDMNAQEFGPWGHADNELFGMLVDRLGDHGVELLFRGKTASHDRVMNFSTGWSWMVDYFRNGFEVAPGAFNDSTVQKRSDHTTNLPDEADTFPDNKMEFAMTKYPFYSSSYRNYLGADNDSNWCLDESASNTTMFQQIWVRGRRDLAKRSMKPMMISNNDNRNKSLSMGEDCVTGEPYSMVLTNGDIVEMSDCYNDENKKVSNLFSHSMNDNNHSCYGSGNNWRAAYTFAKGEMEAVSMKFYQAESYETKQIDIYYTNDDLSVKSPLEDWTPVNNPSATQFHTSTTRTVLRIDFTPVKARKFMIVTQIWNAADTYYGLMEWMIYGYDENQHGVISDVSDKNSQHNSSGKFTVSSSYDFNSGERTLHRITDTEDPYYQLFLQHMNENRGVEDTAFGGNDSVIKAQLNNDDVIYYNCMYSYSQNTGWTIYDATNMFKDETILNVVHQNAYNSYETRKWRFPQTSVNSSRRTGSLIYEFAHGAPHKIRGIQVHGHTESSLGFSAKVRVFHSTSDTELEFVEFKESEHAISLLLSETNTFLDFGDSFPVTNKIMLVFESVWDENIEVGIRDLRIIGKPQISESIITTSQITLQRNNDVVTGKFNYTNMTGTAKLYVNAYSYDYTGAFVSTTPTMTLLPTSNKDITFELTNVEGVDGNVVPAKAVNYIKLFALIEDSVLGTRKMLNLAQLLPEKHGDVQIAIDSLFYDSLMDVVQANISAYSSYAGITGVYGLLTKKYIEDEDGANAKSFILQNAQASIGCVVYKAVTVPQYGIASETLDFSHALSDMGGSVSAVESEESYYLSVLLEDSSGGTTFSNRNLPTKSTYYDLNKLFAGGHDSSSYATGFGNNVSRRVVAESTAITTWLSANTDLVIREVIGGYLQGYLWCYRGDQELVYGWGFNTNGELAYITSGTTHSTSGQTSPVECNGINNLLREKKASIVQFKSGNYFAMLLLSDGKMYSWGKISSYATGFSEDKTHWTITECDIFTKHCTENNVSPVNFACTQNCTIILFSDGTVWGIGDNNNGLLGLGHSNATGATLVACTNVNAMLDDGYEVDLMCARGNSMTYRLKKKGTDELSWWGMGENRNNRALGTTVAAPVLDMTRLDLMEELIATFPDPKNYVVGVGPTNWTQCCMIDLTSNTFWFVGYGHYMQWSDCSNWTEHTSQVNMAANKFVFCAMFSYGVFLATTNDRTIEYQVLDTRSIVSSNILNVTDASTDWSSSTGVTFSGTILASDTNPNSTYTFYATSNLNTTREEAISVISAGTSAALQSGTISTNERLLLKNHIVRNMEVNGQVVPSSAYPKFKLFVHAKSGTQSSMKVLTNEDELVPSLFPNVVEGSFDPFDDVLKVKASVTDLLDTPTNLYVTAFAEKPGDSLTDADIKSVILSTKHLSEVKSLSLSSVATGDIFLSNTLSFDNVFNSVYPQLDEATYESMKANGGTTVVSENSNANIGLSDSASDATWYVWENKYQSGQTVKKWTLQNGDSIYTNSHGEKWFDGNQEDDSNYQPQMYNTNETWVVQGTSRDSVKSWRYFYNVSEERTINTFKLFNHSTNGAHFIKSIGVWNTTKQIYEPVKLNSGSFPMNCFSNNSTSAYKNMHLSFEEVTLEPGKPLMIHLGKMATNLYINEMQLVYETPPAVIPTFFKYMKIHVRNNNGNAHYFTFADIAVLNMEIDSISTPVSASSEHVISRIADNDPGTYHQTQDMSGFDVFITFTYGLPAIFQMKFVNIWNNQAWKDVDVYVSTDNTNWMLSKEVRGLGYAVPDDLDGRTTIVECALPPNVVPVEDIEYSIYAVAENSQGATSISKFAPPPTKKRYFFDRVKSMGYNNHFEAARGTDKTDKSFDVATEVISFLDSNPSIQMIDIIGGGHFTIFEVRNNGQQQFFGIGYNTQQGIGGFDDTNHQSTVVECTGINSLMASEKSGVKKLACGWYNCMVLLENGKMYGFGYNGYGQLGTNNTSNGGKDGLESVMINDYCEQNNTEVLDFACTGYNTFVYLKNNTIRVAGRWNGHGQFGRNNTSETNNTTFHHVSEMTNYLINAKVDFIKCDYGSVMYRVVKNDTGEAKWYGAGQNTDKSIGYSGGQAQVIVECDLLNSFIEEMGFENDYQVVKGIQRSTILIDNRTGRLYGIGDFGSNNPVMQDRTVFTELTNNSGETFLNYNELAENSIYPMRVVKYATLGLSMYVAGTSLTGPQPFEYLEPPTGNRNILRINNLLLTTPDKKGTSSLTLSVTGSILEDTRYYVVLTTDDRASYDFNDEANAFSQATYDGVLPRNESLKFEVAVTDIPDISGNSTPLGVVSKVRAYVFVTDGTHRDYQVYDFGPFVSHPTSEVSSVSFSPLIDKYQVEMEIGASKESVNTYNMVILHPDAEFPEMGEPVSYDSPLIVDSYGSYRPELSMSKSTVSGWIKSGERSLIKKTGKFDLSIDANGKMQAEIQSVYNTSHLERLVETPASSTLWRFKLYTIHGAQTDYATFTQLVLTDESDIYPTNRYDNGADTLFDSVGTTNTNVYLHTQPHKVTYEYASEFTPTKMIWAYKADSPTRAPTRFLIQYCSTTSRSTEADWKDYLYVNLDVEPATSSVPTFHYLDINVAAPDTPRTLNFESEQVFAADDTTFAHVGMTLDSSSGMVQFFKNGVLLKSYDKNYIRMPSVQANFVLDTSADTRYLALRKGLLSTKNMINEQFSGREDLISLITSNSTANTVNIPAGKYSKVTSNFTSALESLDTATSLTVVPEVAYRVLGVLTDVNRSVVFGDVLDVGTQYTTVTYGWASGHNNGYMMMYADELQGNPDFYPTKEFNDFMSANPSYKCLNIEMGGYALMCMIEIDGVIKLYSMGYNLNGQVGNNNTSNQSTMVEAKLFNNYALENNTTVRMVRGGWATMCVLYKNGIVMCIGTNNGCYANGNDTASSTALVEASLVTEYCQINNVEVVDFAIANGECCYLFSNGKILGNGNAMGTSDNTHNQLKETGLNDIMGDDYECTLIRSMHNSFNFRLTHRTTQEERWYGTGEQYHNGGGAPANQEYKTSFTRLTKLEALLATFEDPSDYTYVMGCHRGASFVRDNRTNTFWRIGDSEHIPAFGNTTNFTETTTYITTEWCETNSHSRLTNFTPVYWRMNAYGIFAFGNPLGVAPEVIGGNSVINLTTMSINNVQGSFENLSDASSSSPAPSTESSTASPSLYATLVMNGSVTDSTYYVVASLDSTLDIVRMKNMIATSNPAVVSEKLERGVKGAIKSLILSKVVDAQSNVYDLISVPYAYLFVYLKDANGVEDFDFTAQIVCPDVDLSVPYLQVSSALYDSGSVIVQGTLFSSSVLTGYYASAFQNSAPGDYLVSETPTDLPTGESMLAISTSPNVPFVFSVTLDTVYADDTYASSSDIFGNEGQLALRLITTDGTTPAFKDFDYALGDFIVSTVAVYASTNDSITATVTKKNNSTNTKYTLFASAGDLTSKQILDIIVGKAFAEAKITIGTDTSVVQLDKVISLSEDKQYHVQDISKVSLYTLGTNHMPASVPGNVEIEVDGVRMPASTDTTIDSDSTKTPWILVLNYKNNGGGPIPHGTETWRTVEEGLPVFDDEDDIHTVDMSKLNTEHTLDTLNNGPWGHTGNDLFNKLAIALGSDSVNNNGLETRWVARTILHDRKIHFKSGNSTLMTALRTGSGNINSAVAGDHGTYNDHTASIPQTANGNQTNLGNVTMTYLPLHNMSTNVLWSPERWGVDEGVGTRDGTWFQIWVRADLANCPQAMQDDLIPDTSKMLGSLSVPYSITETNVVRSIPSVKIGETEIDSSNRLILKSQQVSAVQPDNTLYTFGLKLASDETSTHIKNVSVSGGKYLLDGAEQPTITMYVGDHLNMVLEVSSHPLWIKTVDSTGVSNAVQDVTNNGSENGVLFWTPSVEGTYYYNCQYHAHMKGTIKVLNKLSMTHLSTEHITTLANTIFASTLSNVSTQLVPTTGITSFDTPIIFTDIFTSVSGDTKTLDEFDQNVIVVSLLKNDTNTGYVSKYAILQTNVDVSGAQHGTNNANSHLTEVTENGFTHRNTHGSWDYYVKLDQIGLNGIGFNTGLVFEYKTDRATNHRYQPITLFQDQTSILSIYCSFHSNYFDFYANMSTSTQSALRAQIVLGNEYKLDGTTNLTISPKNGSLTDVTHMFHRFIFVDHETDPDLFDIVFEFLDQDRNLIFRSRMDYFHTNHAYAFGGATNPSNFSKSMTSFDLRVYSYANQTAIQYSDFTMTNENAKRDSFTPTTTSAFGTNQIFSS